MKKISILLTITALIVMSIIFFASCDSPVVENLTNILADATTGSGGATGGAGQGPNQPAAVPTTQQVLDVRAALTAIQTRIGPAGPAGNTLEQDAIAAILLLPGTGFANANDATAGRAKILALLERIAPPGGDTLEELVVAATRAADAVAADRNNDQPSRNLVDAVESIKRIVLGLLSDGTDAPPGTVRGIVKPATQANTLVNLPKRVVASADRAIFSLAETENAINELATVRNRLLGGVRDLAPSLGGPGTLAGEVRPGGIQEGPPAGASTGITALTAAALALANAM